MEQVRTIGQVLRASRDALGLSLRQVEDRTGGRIKNGYLSQVENGLVLRPSVEVLWRLAEVYGLEYGELLVLGGHHVPASSVRVDKLAVNGVPLSSLQDLSEAERDDLLAYLRYLRFRRRTGVTEGG